MAMLSRQITSRSQCFGCVSFVTTAALCEMCRPLQIGSADTAEEHRTGDNRLHVAFGQFDVARVVNEAKTSRFMYNEH